MALVLAAYAFATDRKLLHVPKRIAVASMRTLLTLGGPAAGQILLEVGVFGTATMLAARLSPESLAAHHIALQVAGPPHLWFRLVCRRQARSASDMQSDAAIWQRHARPGG